jgi:TasA anchoring/assembly protein
MRSKRLRKFRRQFPAAFFMVKLLLIWYLVIFSVSYLTSGTAAHFYDTEDPVSKIDAGFWADGWDGSSLAFIEKGNTNIKACDPVEITAQVQNMGDGDMDEGSTYDVYYIENGNPEKHGEKLSLPEGEGDLAALKSGESTKLKLLAQEPGIYAFLLHQPEGYPGEETVWSKWVNVNCPSGKAEQNEETKRNNDAEPGTEKEGNPDTNTNESANETNENNNESAETNENTKESANEEREEEMEDEPDSGGADQEPTEIIKEETEEAGETS